MINKRDLQTAAGIFVGRRHNWTVKADITVRCSSTREEGLQKRIKHCLKYVNIPHRVFYEKYVWVAIFLERFRGSYELHIHLLISGIFPERVSDLEKVFNSQLGDSLVELYNPLKRGVFYNFKYYGKPRLVHWDIFRVNSRWRGNVKGGVNYGVQV